MISHVLAVTIKELRVIWHDRQALALLFIMPIFFIVVMSLALEGVFEPGDRTHEVEILLINEDRQDMADRVIADLKKMDGYSFIDSLSGQPIDLKTARELIGAEKYRLALRFQPDFTEGIVSRTGKSSGHVPRATLICDPTISRILITAHEKTIQGVILNQVIQSKIPQIIKKDLAKFGLQQADNGLEKIMASSMSAGLNDEMFHRENILLAVVPLLNSDRVRRPTSTEQNVPGYTIFGVFYIILTLSAAFVAERNNGTLQRILTSPIKKTALIVGKMLPYYLINLIQIGLMFSIGVLFLDLQLGNLPALILVSLALSAAANGLGLLVAAIGKTESQVIGLSVLLAVSLSALGGSLVPAFVMPDFMQTISKFTPHAWALAGYHDVIVRGVGVEGVLREVGVLFCFSGVFFLIAWWRIRFD